MPNCPACGATRVLRSRRRGLFDGILLWFGRWPYRCACCRKRFYFVQRSVPALPVATPVATGKKATIAFRAHEEKPVAQVLIRAESHAELQRILLRLSRAVATYGSVQVKAGRKREHAAQ